MQKIKFTANLDQMEIHLKLLKKRENNFKFFTRDSYSIGISFCFNIISIGNKSI